MRLTAPIAAPNATFTYAAQAIDVDGDAITYALLQSPAGATIDPLTGLVRWLATPGQYAFAIQANDGHGGIATQNFMLTAGTGP